MTPRGPPETAGDTAGALGAILGSPRLSAVSNVFALVALALERRLAAVSAAVSPPVLWGVPSVCGVSPRFVGCPPPLIPRPQGSLSEAAGAALHALNLLLVLCFPAAVVLAVSSITPGEGGREGVPARGGHRLTPTPFVSRSRRRLRSRRLHHHLPQALLLPRRQPLVPGEEGAENGPPGRRGCRYGVGGWQRGGDSPGGAHASFPPLPQLAKPTGTWGRAASPTRPTSPTAVSAAPPGRPGPPAQRGGSLWL